ncbi:MAG: HAD family hydrolase [Actinomycetota bacterium]
MASNRDPLTIGAPAPGRRVVIFDLFGVLTRGQSRRGIDAMARTLREGPEPFQAAYWAERPDYDRGAVSGGEYWDRVARSLSSEIDRDEIDRLIVLDVDSWDRPEPGMVEFAGAVARSRLAAAILSNSPPEITDRFRSYPWMAGFDRSVFSSEVGFVKPEPPIFEHVIAELRIDPDDAVLVDDRAENIEVARSLGMRGFEFRTGESTPTELVAFLRRGTTHDSE